MSEGKGTGGRERQMEAGREKRRGRGGKAEGGREREGEGREGVRKEELSLTDLKVIMTTGLILLIRPD